MLLGAQRIIRTSLYSTRKHLHLNNNTFSSSITLYQPFSTTLHSKSFTPASPKLALTTLTLPLPQQRNTHRFCPDSRKALHTSTESPWKTAAIANPQPPATPHMPPHAPFPIAGLLPKEATEAAKFLSKHPTYDGRNVRVGILDTGVDPAARGLNGKGKVVDVIDCSGGGDIILSPIEESTGTNKDVLELVSPTTGRKLLVSPAWKKDSSTPWLVGFKRAYDLWPSDLVSRRKAQRKKNWDVETAKLVAGIQRKLADLEGNNGATDEKTKVSLKEELKTRLAVLGDLESSYSDPGPLLETITFFDGEHWRTVVGGAEGDIVEPTLGLSESSTHPLAGQTLDLRNAPRMADFRIEHQHDVFGAADLLTYSVNHIFESTSDPKQPSGISLVTLSGSHGTHVAGITGAHLPESPEENGVAPGVEIVSLRIGDVRLNGMETGQALLRAAQALISTKCDIANMSFGEDGAFGLEGAGAFAAALRDIVIRQKDILFVSSAGNSAPALTTLGHPAGTTDGIFTIGAYVNSGPMQDAEYALVERGVKDSPTTWSSRGPAADGARGTTVYSPGAAITSIPKYCLQATQLMNGTSMASPNACGCISLLLSGMKQEGIPITSARVHKAITATAKDFHDELGIGFIQTDKAFEYIVANQGREDADFEFSVTVSPPGKPVGRSSTDKRGIYLREKLETRRVNQFMATVKPLIKGTQPEKAYNLQLRCNLTSNVSWVSAPDFLLLGSNGRSFEIRVDPTQLAPGLHVASVKGYDSETPGQELFEVPITVTKPEVSSEPTVRYTTTLKEGKLERHFIHVPEGSTWCEARFRSSNHGVEGTTAKFWAHFVTLEPQRRLSFVEQSFVLALTSGEPITRKFAVKGGQTLEVCLAEMWNSAQRFDIDVDLEFHGITIGHAVSGRDDLTLIGGEGMVKIECMSNVRLEAFTPTISFSKRRTFVRPANSVIRPLIDPRNLHPNGKMMGEVINSYQLTVNEGGPVKLSWPTSSPLSNLYDSSVPMLTAIFETNTKKAVAFGDVYPKAKDLPKGEYTIRVQWLNDDPSVLKALKTATMLVEQNLSKGKDITLSPYEDHVAAFGPAKPATFKGGAVKLLPGERKVLNLDLNLHGDALPKEAQAGDILVGEFGFAPDGKYTLKYVVAPVPKKEDSGDNGGKDDEPSLPELLAPVSKKLKGDQKKKFLETLLKEHPSSLPVLLAQLESLDSSKKEEVDEVIAAADAVVKEIDVQSVLLWLGEKRLPTNEQSEEEKKENKKYEEKKKALITAYLKKGKALLAKDVKDASSLSAFKSTFESARKLLGESTDNREWATLRIANYLRDEGGEGFRPGHALQNVRKLIKEMGAGDSTNKDELAKAKEQERELLKRLGWDVWSAYEDRWRIISSPKDWAPF